MNNVLLKYVFAFVLMSILTLLSQSCKDECKEVICQNGGACVDGACACPQGFTGDYCEIPIGNTSDTIYFVVDGIKVSKGEIVAKTTNSVTIQGDFQVVSNQYPISDYGFVYSKTNQMPTLADNSVSKGPQAGIGQYTVVINGLQPNTTYRTRMYLKSNGLTKYLDATAVLIFTTLQIQNPNILTSNANNITTNSAAITSNISSLGSYTEFSGFGHCWDTLPNPKIDGNPNIDFKGTIYADTIFTSNLTNLLVNRTYYARAYATNGDTTFYGNQVQFTTTNLIQPILSLSSAFGVGYNTSQATITISSLGEYATIYDYGIVWATNFNPTLGSNPNQEIHNGATNQTGSSAINISNLQYSTLYHARAFIKTDATANPIYSNDISFTTLTPTPPTLNGITISNLTNNSVILNTGIPVIGTFPLTNYGFCWATTPNPVVNLNPNIYSLGSANNPIPSFSYNLTGLEENTLYYVRSFATPDGINYTYSAQQTFTTPQSLPTLSDITISNMALLSLSAEATITQIGLSNVTQYGFCYSSINTMPSLDNGSSIAPIYQIETASVTFNQPLSDLTPSTTYYIRAYAVNSYGTAYSNLKTVNTLDPITATVTTVSTSDIGNNVATFTGNITNLGNVSITEHGFCYAYKNVPTIDSTKIDLGTVNNTGTFESTALGLKAGTNYMVRAYTRDALNNVRYGTTKYATTTETGLVLYYPFNGNYNDASGNNYDGETTAIPTLTSGHNEVSNTCYDFDGLSQYIKCSDGNIGNFSQNSSMSFWIYTHSSNFASGKHSPIGKRIDYQTYYYLIDKDENLNLNFIYCHGCVFCSQNQVDLTNPNLLSQGDLVNNWHFIGIVRNLNVVYYYVDGSLVGTDTYSFSNNQTNETKLYIGSDGCDNYFKGKVDEVRFYNYALNATQIADIYNR